MCLLARLARSHDTHGELTARNPIGRQRAPANAIHASGAKARLLQILPQEGGLTRGVAARVAAIGVLVVAC